MNRWIGILVCLLWSGISFANEQPAFPPFSDFNSLSPKSSGSNYEFGVLENKQCNNGCEINFNKAYRNPVVFLMASVNATNGDSGYPTKVSISNVTSTGAVIYSDALPNYEYADYMQKIYYMVADPGWLTFYDKGNNKKIVEVGVIDTNKDQYKWQSNSHAIYSWSNVRYGRSHYSTPVVLAQIQSINSNYNYWVSGALSNVTSSSFNLAIERGRRGSLPWGVNARVAYLVAPQFSGFNESKDTKVEFFRPSKKFDQDGKPPIKSSCYTNKVFTNNTYSEFGVIVNKQTRNGSDGGWLRYCQQPNNETSFSFAFDEDNVNNRSHGADEYVAYMAFESKTKPLPPSEIDICKYVPDVAQTNDYVRDSSGVLKPNGALSISNKSTIELKTSNILSFGSSSSSNSCDYGQGKEKCVISKDKTYDGFPFQLNTLTGFDNSQFNCDRECTLPSGKYNQVRVDQNAKLTLSGDHYEINELVFEQNAQLLLKNDTQINYNRIYFDGNDILINQNSHHKLLFLGHGYYSSFYINNKRNNNIKINAYIHISGLSSGFYVGENKNNNVFTGGVTAKEINFLKSNSKIIAGDFNCTPPVESKIARIDIIPNNYHLTCDDTEKVYVVAYDQSGAQLYDVGDDVVSLTTPTPGKMAISALGFNATDGRYEFSVDKKDNQYESVVVNATLQSNTSVSDSSNVLFTPLKFEINEGAELELIAGKPATFAIKALACSSGKPVTTNYSKVLTENNIASHSFTPGSWTDNRIKLSFNAPFVSGTANASLTFNDAGRFTGTLSDTIQCSDFGSDIDGCPVEDKKKIAGDFSFKARPWTFAICNSQTKPLPQGDITDVNSARFVAAGDKFTANVLPIRWMANQSSPVETANNYCDSRLVTQNFFLGQGENAGEELINIALTHDVAEPAGKEKGELSGNASKLYTDSTSKNNHYYQFANLAWSEVGVLRLTASASAPYLGMDIDPGYRDVGRFYPHHFTIRNSEFLPHAGLGSAAYMAQPYQSAQVYVDAYAKDTATQTLQNYRWFTPGLTADFALIQDANVPNQLILDTSIGHWSEDNGNSAWVLTDTNSFVTRDMEKLAPLTTVPNGPLNTSDDKAIETEYALGLVGNVDPAFFIVEGEEVLQQNLPTQPKAQYGRMVLGSVGGTAGSEFGVPLQTQYWDGERFTLAKNDSYSQLTSNDDYLCKETVWLDDGMTAPTGSSLNGTDDQTVDVENGKFDGLTAKADTTNSAIREQVRFWMRIAASSPQQALTSVDCGPSHLEQPWLQYNWRGQGDEDPSASITFGIYRGNDKIIFRGESGVMGQ